MQQTGTVCKSFLPMQMQVLWESVPPGFCRVKWPGQVLGLCALSHVKAKVVKSAAQDIMIQTGFSEEFQREGSVL